MAPGVTDPGPAPGGGSGGGRGTGASGGGTMEPTAGSGPGGVSGTGGGAGTAGSGGGRGGVDAAATPGVGPEAGTPATPPEGFECGRLLAAGGPMSQWVYPDGSGKLAYKPLNAGGDHIMDFSHAGYGGGGVALPTVPVAETADRLGRRRHRRHPGRDRHGRSPAARERRPRRGAAARRATFLVSGNHQHPRQRRGPARQRVGRGRHRDPAHRRAPAGLLHGAAPGRARSTRPPPRQSPTNTSRPAPPPSRSTTPPPFKVGDAVVVGRPVTAAWISLLGMDQLVRNGAPQTWIRPGSVLRGERVITAIDGNRITVDIPYPDSFDGKYVKPPGGSIARVHLPRPHHPGRDREPARRGLAAAPKATTSTSCASAPCGTDGSRTSSPTT